MIVDDDELYVMDALHRIFDVRNERCGRDGWRDPPADWQVVIFDTWPGLFNFPPSCVPDGWIDLLLALADELDGRNMSIMACHEDLRTGALSLKVAAPDDDETQNEIAAYEHVASMMCRVCGGKATIRRTGVGTLARAKAVCDVHGDNDEDEQPDF